LLRTNTDLNPLQAMLRYNAELEERIDRPKPAVSGPRRVVRSETLADLDSLTETLIEQDGKRFLVRAPRVLPQASRPAPLASPCRPTGRQQPTQPAPKCSATAPTWLRLSASYDLLG
jgi:hypothetical protein